MRHKKKKISSAKVIPEKTSPKQKTNRMKIGLDTNFEMNLSESSKKNSEKPLILKNSAPFEFRNFFPRKARNIRFLVVFSCF
jgi:hypothetical protein